MTTVQDFYNLIEPNDLADLMTSIENSKVDISLKINNLNVQTQIISKVGPQQYSIRKFNTSAFKNELAPGSFEMNKNKYFFKVELNSKSDNLIMTVPKEIFILQRRDNFRVTVPIGVIQKAAIQSLNGKKVGNEVEIRDVSMGGCLITFKKSKNIQLKKNDELQIKIKILDLEKELIVCLVKHIKLLDGDTLVQAGLLFEKPEGDFLTDLQALLIQLDRIHRGKKYA